MSEAESKSSEDGPTQLICEYEFDHPIGDDEWDEMATRLEDCLNVRGVVWKRSYLALDRLRRICVYEAADAEAVREAYRRAKVKFTRIWAAEAIE
ncbi:MAG TPA: nickel-binding protein [bacterium]|nr:nickel-binding protein [bacterium]